MSQINTDDLSARFSAVQLLSLDVDGVLTDGGIYFDDDGREMRKFNAKDGMGIKLAQKAGIDVCLISASVTPSIKHRAKRLGIRHVHTGVASKIEVLKSICGELGIGLADVAHMGDDVNDLTIFEAVGLALCPADAVDVVRSAAGHIAKRNGGAGCVREICEQIIAARAGQAE